MSALHRQIIVVYKTLVYHCTSVTMLCHTKKIPKIYTDSSLKFSSHIAQVDATAHTRPGVTHNVSCPKTAIFWWRRM